MSKYYKTLIGYSIIHGIMDLCSVTIILYTASTHDFSAHNIFIIIALYSALAFGTQPFFGLLIDKLHITKESSVIGSLLVLSSFFVTSPPLLVVILAGLGSSLFHVSGGSITLNIAPTKATPISIFAAPGVLGLITGITIGTHTSLILWPFIFLLIASSIFMITAKLPPINHTKISIKSKIDYFKFIIILLLFFVAVKSMYGLNAVFAWQHNLTLLYILTLAVVVGKITGGISADNFGWLKMATITLIISIPLVLFFPTNPILIVIGVFLFSMTMPLPIAALSNMLPGRSAFIFGIIEFFILFQYLGGYYQFTNQWLSLLIIVMATIALLIGLKLLQPYFKNQLKINL